MASDEEAEVKVEKKWNRVLFRIGEDKHQLITVERNSPYAKLPSKAYPVEDNLRARRNYVTAGASLSDSPDVIRTDSEAEYEAGPEHLSNKTVDKDGTMPKGKKRKRITKKSFKKAGKRVQWVLKKGCKGLGWCVIKIFNTNAAVYNQDSRTCVC